MDLLQGYGSDNSSSSEQPPPAKPTASTIPSASTQARDASSKKTATKTSNKRKKKGTRILKLNSVLPADILERLTRSSVQRGDGKFEDDDSSDDENDNTNYGNDTAGSNLKNGGNNKKSSNVANKQSKSKRFLDDSQKNVGGDSGLNSLLSELGSVEPTAEDIKKKKKSASNDSGKMGLAFMNVSNTVVRKKANVVTDIHATTSKQSKVSVEDVDSNDDEDETEDVNVNDDAIAMFPKAPSYQTMQEEVHKPSSESNVRKATSSIGSTSIKRPRTSVTAAPTIPSNYQSLKMPIQHAAATVAQPHSYTSYNQHTNTHQNQYQAPLPAAPTQPQPKKMSKRELQKALRQGNFDAINSANITQNIDSSNYAAPSENDLLATASTSNPSSSEFKTGGLQMYVPSEGSSVATGGVSSKQRGKHQIHSLVASARKLEADRARLGAMGMGGKKSNRVDAKRKYGW